MILRRSPRESAPQLGHSSSEHAAHDGDPDRDLVGREIMLRPSARGREAARPPFLIRSDQSVARLRARWSGANVESHLARGECGPGAEKRREGAEEVEVRFGQPNDSAPGNSGVPF